MAQIASTSWCHKYPNLSTFLDSHWTFCFSPKLHAVKSVYIHDVYTTYTVFIGFSSTQSSMSDLSRDRTHSPFGACGLFTPKSIPKCYWPHTCFEVLQIVEKKF